MKHKLVPFPDEQAQSWNLFSLGSSITKSQESLDIEFQLTGNLSTLVWPPTVESSTRQDNLWETTCFEFFFAEPNSKNYWEVNLSPSGHWNVYGFKDYRQGMQPEKAIASLNIKSNFSENKATLTCSIPIDGLGLSQKNLDISITSVLALEDGSISYWAVDHVAAEADFHQRESFQLQVS